MPSIRNGQLDYNSSNISVPKFTPVENPLATFMDLRDDRAKTALAEKQAAEDRKYLLEQRALAKADREKKLAADKALVEYASTPFNTNRALDTQRALADQALLEDSANRLAKYEASLKEHNVTQDDVNKGRVSQAILDKIANPGLDVDRASSINNVYSNITPFREDVMATVKRDLIAKGVDPSKAAEYAKTEATQYTSIPEYQKSLNQKAKDKTTASKDNAEWNLKIAKLTKDILKDAKSGTSSDAGINKLYEQARASGNPDAATALIDTALKDGYSTKQIAKEFARGGVGTESDFWNLKDWGKVDARVDEVMGRLAKEGKSGNFISKSLGDYSKMLTTPQTYSAVDARRKSQTDARSNMLEALGIVKPAKAAITTSTANGGSKPKVTGSSNEGGTTIGNTKKNAGGIFYPGGTKKGEYPEEALTRKKVDWSKESDDQLLISLDALTKKNGDDGIFGSQINRLIDEIESRGGEDLSHMRVKSNKQEDPSELTKIADGDLPRNEDDIKTWSNEDLATIVKDFEGDKEFKEQYEEAKAELALRKEIPEVYTNYNNPDKATVDQMWDWAKDNKEKNLLEILGVSTGEEGTSKDVKSSKRQKYLENPDASRVEPGLSNQGLPFIPAGKVGGVYNSIKGRNIFSKLTPDNALMQKIYGGVGNLAGKTRTIIPKTGSVSSKVSTISNKEAFKKVVQDRVKDLSNKLNTLDGRSKEAKQVTSELNDILKRYNKRYFNK